MEYGFDLTHFGSAKKFDAILKKHGLVKYQRLVRHSPYHRVKYYVYSWKGLGLEIHTGNNPLTGAYSSPERRQKEKGYASYIGIEGHPARVTALARDIHSDASIKGHNPTHNEYIW